MGLDLYAGPLTRYVTSAWQTIIEQAADATVLLVRDGLEAAQNTVHAWP